ncbi:MAG: PQQ-binding-like beta-propeller repeat protein [Acidobacteriota bacterium]
MSVDSSVRPLRVWPGVVIVVFQWLVRFGLPLFVPSAMAFAAFGGVFGGTLLILLWWLFFSRARWVERLGAVALIAGGLFVTSLLVDVSVATSGQGMLFIINALPIVCLALVIAAWATRNRAVPTRFAAVAAAILLACGAWTLVRFDGVTGDFGGEYSFRWAPTAEEKLLAATENEVLPPVTVPDAAPPVVEEATEDDVVAEATAEAVAVATEDVAGGVDEPLAAVSVEAEPVPSYPAPAWPGFRGAERDSIITGVRIDTDWATTPPTELWRRPVGPGWSSFAVNGQLIYTQEQRGEDEVVASYDLDTGEPVWRHTDSARFWEAMGGAGPRGTPTLHQDRVYALGATGILNALDAQTGAVVWSRETATDTGAEVPTWGVSGSPLVHDDRVYVAVSGTLAAYDAASGESLWNGPDGKVSYSSPHIVELDGVPQVLLNSAIGITSLDLGDGSLLWQHEWDGASIVQPAVTPDAGLLLSAEQVGAIRLAVGRDADAWTVEERWASNRLKASFNDFVIHNGHAYGFDGTILTAIDIETGERAWKGGRYGAGQLVLLADQDMLLVLSEKGELALVQASPDGYAEVAKVPGLNGKTWNHPVLVGDVLLARNSEEMAAFRLQTDG